jgi:hypothetical protein
MERLLLSVTLSLAFACGGFSRPTFCHNGGPVEPSAEWKATGLLADGVVCEHEPESIEVEYPGDDTVASGGIFFRVDESLKRDGWTLLWFDLDPEVNALGIYDARYRKGDLQRSVFVGPNEVFHVTTLRVKDELYNGSP